MACKEGKFGVVELRSDAPNISFQFRFFTTQDVTHRQHVLRNVGQGLVGDAQVFGKAVEHPAHGTVKERHGRPQHFEEHVIVQSSGRPKTVGWFKKRGNFFIARHRFLSSAGK